jgi:RES domain-containing protein
VVVWRICARRLAARAFDGEGARTYGGRWNHPGVAVVYASATLSLAILELLVHVDAETVPEKLVAFAVDIPERLAMTRVANADLPAGWRRYPSPEATLDVGTRWAREGRTAVLVVPCGVVPQESNYLLNPAHPEFGRLRIGRAQAFRFDPRLVMSG